MVDELAEAGSYVREQADPDAHIIFGMVFDETMGDRLRCTIIATDFARRNQSDKASGSSEDSMRSVRGDRKKDEGAFPSNRRLEQWKAGGETDDLSIPAHCRYPMSKK